MQCDRSNETSLAAFSRGTFYFSAFYKVKFWNFLEFFYFVLLWQCKVDNQVQSFTSLFLSPMPKFPLDPSS